ncbi:MAG: hypothetical protein CVU65_17555, partial [Deltaproteobacteria bacterium HGW-Deltaproteobacteria-22]
MKTKTIYDDILYKLIGSRYGSTLIQQEGQDVVARWKEFIDVMLEFGFGPDELAEFIALLEQHRALIHSRSQSVIAKGVSIDTRNAILNNAWTWVSKVRASFYRLSRTDVEVARALNESNSDLDPKLPEIIRQLKTLLTNKGSLLSPAIPVAPRIAEADDLITSLVTIFGETNNAKGKPMDDTAEIDLLDGKIYVIIRDFNEAGRAAVRAGLLPDRAP